jgi:hypothetical protein
VHTRSNRGRSYLQARGFHSADTVGQRIRLNVENTLGGGGQRQIAVFCPYWIVNTSQYSLRVTEEGVNVLPAGTVTAQK